MPTEQEELKLIVTLVDNASAGLDKIVEKTKEMGGSQVKEAHAKMTEGSKELTKVFKDMTGGFGEAFKALTSFSGGMVAGIAGLAGFALTASESVKKLKELANELRSTSQAARAIGVDPMQLKSVVEQFEAIGINADQTKANIARMSEAIADMSRQGSQMRQWFLHEAGPTPQAQAAMGEFLRRMQEAAKQGDLIAEYNALADARQAVLNNALREGYNLQEATNRANLFASKLWDNTIAQRRKLTEDSREEQALTRERIKQGEELANITGEIASEWSTIIELAKQPFFGPAIRGAQILLDVTKGIHELIVKIESEKLFQPDEAKKSLQKPFEKFGFGGPPTEGEKQTSEETRKNTDQLRRLNESFDMFKQTPQGYLPMSYVGGGFNRQFLQNANFATGGGVYAGAGPPGGGGGFGGVPGGGYGAGADRGYGPFGGGGGFGGVPGGGGAYGPYGGRAPYGSSVGPGTGAGAGHTPAAGGGGGGAPNEPGGPRSMESRGGSGGITAPAGTPIQRGGMTTVTTPSGKSFRVDSRYAENFKGFLSDYEKAGGVIGSASGTLGERPHNASGHPIGTAIDINQIGRDIRGGTGKSLPPGVEDELAKKWGFVSGHTWRNPDTGHFGIESSKTAKDALIANGVAPDEADRIVRGGGTPNGQTAGPGTGKGAGGTPAGVSGAIHSTAGTAGMDVAHWKAIASIESDLNPSSNINARTQYKGLFQINRGELGGRGDIYNPQTNAEAAAAIAASNNAWFKSKYGREPTPTETYMMHQQGRGFYSRGTMTNIAGNPYPGMRGPQTHESFEAGWGRELERRAQRYQSDREQIDGASAAAGKVEGTGKISVDVNAPKGTHVDAESGGIFKDVEINRQTQMEPARKGPETLSI
jgi:hypothetical protein